jgi:hypothetical protein
LNCSQADAPNKVFSKNGQRRLKKLAKTSWSEKKWMGKDEPADASIDVKGYVPR